MKRVRTRGARGMAVGLVTGLSLVVSGLVTPAASAADECTIGVSTISQCFPDQNLAAKIATKVRASVGDTFTKDKADSITSLYDLNDAGIKDLTGIQVLTNVKDVNLNINEVSDLTPLKGLTQLEQLEVGSNPISDITPLSGLTNLAVLSLSETEVKDLTPLKGLSKLDELDAGYSQISDLSPLSGITDLRALNVMNNQVKDLSPLNGLNHLEFLVAANNQISDVASLTDVPALNNLILDNNTVRDISPVSRIQTLQTLSMNNNQVHDLSSLAALPKLLSLSASGQRVVLPGVGGSSVSVSTAKSVDGSFVAPTTVDPVSGVYDAASGKVSWQGLSGKGEISVVASTKITTGLLKNAPFDVTFTQPFDADAPVPTTSHTVTFDSRGGSAVAPVSVKDGEKADRPADPVRSGYTFLGWRADEAGRGPYDFSWPVTEDVTLYAQWQRTDEVGKDPYAFSGDGRPAGSGETGTKKPAGKNLATTGAGVSGALGMFAILAAAGTALMAYKRKRMTD
ncbi:leucine-rich repeat domain-containing protein [Bifidobacterium psychraerophilum]|uniref:leucine-rich repeat domain-containing protein n=1 Tax=Bifidobacterium psychraerophilum TaxID=218140 RepID=UPI0023F23B2B|nr:leucine-rich repeat domain-containing protein [Bifidobacterium psychraerophilum]MCI1660370.1 InlB B-repeat-containing protein [Bifidobacterium psychraerophilum]MCI1804123.1 InlB B-repeat-containing protein [Bifidobacterium psychraerophilum]MCI2176517.1 InlB B-repeat-containing protein [Bifidobacterium psychraerophilum]MCI2182032.1 InlB B-repeat-containing protein [Bifidobacterium psychraerophilum]